MVRWNGADAGHEWDGIRELNHPLPRWWIVMYLGLCAIAVGIMVLYPALGGWSGLELELKTTSC
ncbi:hypothetical protein OURE66S_00613 [Oligella ureolytica]